MKAFSSQPAITNNVDVQEYDYVEQHKVDLPSPLSPLYEMLATNPIFELLSFTFKTADPTDC